MGLFAEETNVAIDGSKFKAVAQIDESVARYLDQLDTADLQKASEVLAVKTDAPRRAHFSGLLSERVPRSDGWIGVMPMLCNALG
jgi:hypothetical protein